MKDVFKNYHKHQVLSNLGLLAISAVLAVSVNMFILSGATGETLKANVLEATLNQNQKVDFIASHDNDSIEFYNTHEMKNVSEISFSLAYNYEILELGDFDTTLEIGNISIIENNDGFTNYIMTFVNPVNISQNINIIDINYKKIKDETAHLNIVNVNFKDIEGELYLLSSEGIMF